MKWLSYNSRARIVTSPRDCAGSQLIMQRQGYWLLLALNFKPNVSFKTMAHRGLLTCAVAPSCCVSCFIKSSLGGAPVHLGGFPLWCRAVCVLDTAILKGKDAANSVGSSYKALWFHIDSDWQTKEVSKIKKRILKIIWNVQSVQSNSSHLYLQNKWLLQFEYWNLSRPPFRPFSANREVWRHKN